MRRVTLIVSLIGLLGGDGARATSAELDASTAAHREALLLITQAAKEICNNLSLEGRSRRLVISGGIEAELDTLLNILADLNLEGSAEYRNEEFRGLLQEDLGQIIKANPELIDKTSCRMEIYRDLVDRLMPEKQRAHPGLMGAIFKELEVAAVNVEYARSILGVPKFRREWPEQDMTTEYYEKGGYELLAKYDNERNDVLQEISVRVSGEGSQEEGLTLEGALEEFTVTSEGTEDVVLGKSTLRELSARPAAVLVRGGRWYVVYEGRGVHRSKMLLLEVAPEKTGWPGSIGRTPSAHISEREVGDSNAPIEGVVVTNLYWPHSMIKQYEDVVCFKWVFGIAGGECTG